MTRQGKQPCTRPIYSRITDGNGRIVYEGYDVQRANRIWARMLDNSKVLVAAVAREVKQ